MLRYQGRADLPESPRVAVIANDQIGNFVVATPLLQLLRKELKAGSIHYYGGVRSRELELASDLFEESFPLHGSEPREALRFGHQFEYDLVVNVEDSPLAKAFAGFLGGAETRVCGPAVGPRGDLPYPEDAQGNLWRDREWISDLLLTRYPFLSSPFIAEIYCRLAYLQGPLPPYRVPTETPAEDTPEVLISTGASLAEKLWTTSSWRATLSALKLKGHRVGLIGAKPGNAWKGGETDDEILRGGLAEDWRGRLTLPQVAGALAQARLLLTLDNGILHLGAAVGTPTVGLFRYGIHRLWSPPVSDVRVLTAGDNRPVSDIGVETVLEAVLGAL